MATDRVPCTLCASLILPATALANKGLCAQCAKISPEQRKAKALAAMEPDPFGHAITLYSAIIDDLTRDPLLPNFGGMADPQFECLRFYFFESIDGSFNYDTATELAPDRVNLIEYYLAAASPPQSLLHPLLQKLRSIAPQLNSAGKTIFLGDWGMAPAEIGWLIRYINDRPTFQRYLQTAHITEADVDAFDEAYRNAITPLLPPGDHI